MDGCKAGSPFSIHRHFYQKLEKQVSEAVSLSKTSRQNLLTHMYTPGSISCLQSAQHKHIKLAVVQCVRQTG